MEPIPCIVSSSKSNNVENLKKKLSFKLYFPIKQKVGYATGNYSNKVSVVTSKFYSRVYTTTCDSEELQNYINRLKFSSPKQKYKLPNTENQRYGWYRSLVNEQDSYMNFAKSTHQLIKEHLMNYAKIRE